ncbi:MAG: rubrerythrin family protein [Pelatocladus maniniholoensis HA4357-MV3]|jgi:rubrerythrin|uniref:Rubrerythrin family protein n=1 Tax=Pelatocladus maniniholoensis HA4357-MV3 TaxID=1117104 RepID=A0A9E3H4Q1_9NOST|nr:rubrerythrin family protein [Pelatocladus maniniholoensis HA4357-MV3]BAZ65513.1 rubredoxin-type Fe(Cys)4 protein [Fischerella sp. NIES-4106]
MDLSNSNTANNLGEAFAGESMANRKYLFFAEVTRQLGMSELSKLFRETANQETEHAFAHFRLMHPELVVGDVASLTEEQKKAIASRCLELAIEGETYEYTTMYPGFTEQARADRDSKAVVEFEAQQAESREHASIFRKAAHNFGLLTHIENHHARQYTEALQALEGISTSPKAASGDPATQKWICRQCSMIYNPVEGDPDSGIAPGTPFEAIPEDWYCPICGASKKTFVPYQEAVAA